jgi:hypothetical protein
LGAVAGVRDQVPRARRFDVTTEAHPGVRRSAPDGIGSSSGAQVMLRRGRAGLGLAIFALVATLALVWMAGESHYKSCVAAASAKFPAVPVSAFNGSATGPLKVSFTSERQKAVSDCHRF